MQRLRDIQPVGLQDASGRVLRPMQAGELTLPVFTPVWFAQCDTGHVFQRTGGVYRRQAASFRARVYLHPAAPEKMLQDFATSFTAPETVFQGETPFQTVRPSGKININRYCKPRGCKPSWHRLRATCGEDEVGTVMSL